MRYLPLTAADRRIMLDVISVADVDDLFCAVPPVARRDAPLDLPPHMGEAEVERSLSALASRNVAAGSTPFFLGAGAYRHHVPASVDHLIQRSEFLTSYTPYQPEIAQGTLQALFEFQTQVARLTGMEVANASMYDGSTACAEAVRMAHRVTKRRKAVLAGGLHPHYRAVAENMSRFSGDEVTGPAADPAEDPAALAQLVDEETSCLVVQTPDVFGNLHDLRPLAAAAHAHDALLVAVVTEVVSLGAVLPPGAMGADIVAAEGQSLGLGLGFGGPYVGLLAARKAHVRQLPGRICGQTVDADGRRGFVLTLSTREQHIRRERATSNICTNAGLCCLAFTIHLALLGEQGLRRLAQVNHAHAVELARLLEDVPGVEVLNRHFFNEFTVRTPRPGADIVAALARKGVLGGVAASRLWPGAAALDRLLLVACTETATASDRAACVRALREVLA